MVKYRDSNFIIFVVIFFLFLDTHFQMPVLASFASYLGATPFYIGLIVGMYSLFNIFGNIISGILIDSGGNRKILITGISFITVSLYLYTFAYSPLFLLCTRAFHGFAGGLVIPATLVYLTGTPLKNESDSLSKRMSFYGVAIGLSALMGPPLAGILASAYGFSIAYLIMALLMTVAAFLTFVFLREDKTKVRDKILMKGYFKEILASPYMVMSFKFVFVLMGSTGVLASFLPLKATALGATPAFTGALYGVFAAMAIILHLCWPSLARRFSLTGNAFSGFLLLIAALTMINYLQILSLLFFALALYGTGFGIIFPASLEMVAQGSEPSKKGIATAFFFVCFSLGAALLPPLSGFLMQSSIELSPFLTAALVSLIVAVFLIPDLRKLTL